MNLAQITHVTTGLSPMKPHVLRILNSGSSSDHFVVLDIDDTLLVSMPGAVGTVSAGMWVLRAAVDRNLDVFIVTARPDTPINTRFTRRELEAIGIFARDDHLYMRPPHINTPYGISVYKSSSRDDIEERTGKKCLLTVGDQWSDISIVNDEQYAVLSEHERGDYILTRLHQHGHGLKLNR